MVTYLCAKGSSEAEEDFEHRWNALRPNLLGSTTHTASSTALVLTPTPVSADAADADQTQAVELASSASSSFPLLEHISDSFHSDTGDDLLTVTETSHGLNFEYKWEQARAEQPYCSSSTSGPLGQGNPHYQDIYYSSKGSTSGGCKTESLTSTMSSSYYEPEHPGVVPVLSAHSPSVSSEYYIRIEEPVECNINLDDSVVDYSPGMEASNSRLSPESLTASSMAQPSAYWSTADNTKSTASDSDSSPTVQLTMEPLLRQASSISPVKLGHSHNCLSSNQDCTIFCEQPYNTGDQSCLSELDTSLECISNHVHPVGCLDGTRSLSQAVSSPSLGFCDPFLERSTGCTMVKESCHNMMVRKNLSIVNHISIDVGTDDGLLVGQWQGENTENDLFSEGEATNWTSNHSANNNSLSFDSRNTDGGHDSYLDFQYTAHSNPTQSWSLTKATTRTFQSTRCSGTLEAEVGDTDCKTASKPTQLSSYIQLRHKEREEAKVEMNMVAKSLRNNDSLKSSNNNARGSQNGKMEGKCENPLLLNGERLFSEPKMIPDTSYIKSSSSFNDPSTSQTGSTSDKQRGNIWEGVSAEMSVGLGEHRLNYTKTSEKSGLDSGMGVRDSCISLAELGDYSEDDDDDDITDITSAIFADLNLDHADVLEEEELSPLKNPKGTPESVDTINLSSSMASTCDQAFSPDPFNTPILPKSLDSGYDTENNESPEFFFKELGDVQTGERSPRLAGEPELVLQVDLGHGLCTSTSTSELPPSQLKGLTEKNPYRDSAYFSDYDVENERSPQEESSKFFAGPSNHDFHAEKRTCIRDDGPVQRKFNNEHLTYRHSKSCFVVNLSEVDPGSPHSLPTPGLSMLSPFPPQMGGCLTKESAPADDDLGLETEQSGEDPPSELSTSIGSEASSTVREASANNEESNRRADDCSPVQSLNSESTINEYRDEASKENENGDGSTEEEELPEFSHVKDETEDKGASLRINEEDFEDIDAEECDSQDSLCEESNGPELSTSSSLMELCGEDVRAPLEEAEDEDDSDDSESDEELRTYNIQDEDSEESEEDFTTVPVVVSDCSRARHLRSLLKMPTLLTQSFCDELERKKKAVSFFDDVTVFLFDQVRHVNQ